MALAPVGVRLVVENITQFNAALLGMRRQIALLSATGKGAGTSMGGLTGALSSYQGRLQALPRFFGHLSQAIGDIGNVMRRTGEMATGLGVRLTFLFSVPVFSGISAVSKAAKDFELAIVQINTLAEVSIGQAKAWGDEILRIAPSLGTTPQAMAEGLLAITSAGFVTGETFEDMAHTVTGAGGRTREAFDGIVEAITQGDSAMEILRVSTKASVAGFGEIDEVGKAVSAMMISYADSNLTAARAVDILVQTAREGAAEVDALAPSIGRVTGLAAQLGVTPEELGAFLATYTRAGVPATVAITSLRAALTSIIKPTQASIDQLAKYDITMQEVRDAIADPNIGLAKTLIALQSIFSDDVEAMSKLIGTSRGLAGVLFVTGGAANDYLNILDRIKDSSGVVETVFETTARTASFQWNQLRSTFGVLAITIGSVLLPAINELVQRIMPMVQALAEFLKERPNIVLTATAFALLAATLGPLFVIGGILISTFGVLFGALSSLIAVIGFLLTPIGLLVAGLAILAGALGITLIAALNGARRESNKTFSEWARDAFVWGKNLVISLANGIAAATIAVVQALVNLGNVIAGWLRPGSPPALLPDLPEWGASAMNEYMRGWLQADFSIFDDLAGIMGNLIRSLSVDVFGGEEGVIPAIFGSRENIARIVQQIREVGIVSQELLAALTGQFGPIGADVAAYIEILARLQGATEAVTAAEAELAAIKSAFDERISPIDDALQAITDERARIATEQRRAVLQGILDDPRAPELARILALMELEEIALQEQRRLILAEQEAAIDNAQTQLDAAQEQVSAIEEEAAAQKALIEAQIEHNNLMAQQLALLERLADSIDSLGGATGGATEAIGIGAELAAGSMGVLSAAIDAVKKQANKPPGIFEGLEESLEESFSGIKNQFAELTAEITASFAPLLGEDGLLRQLENTWLEVWTRIGQVEALPETVVGIGKIGLALLAMNKIIPGSVGFLANLAKALGSFLVFSVAPLIGSAATGAYTGILGLVAAIGLIPLLIAAAAVAIGALIVKYAGNGGFAAFFDDANFAIGRLNDILEFYLFYFLNQLTNVWIPNLILKLGDLGVWFKETLPETIKNFISGAAENFLRWLLGADQETGKFTGENIEKFNKWKDDLVGEDGVLAGVTRNFLEAFSNLGPDIIETVSGWVGTVSQAFYNAGVAFITELISGLGSLSLTNFLSSLITGAVAGITSGGTTPLPSGTGSSGGLPPNAQGLPGQQRIVAAPVIVSPPQSSTRGGASSGLQIGPNTFTVPADSPAFASQIEYIIARSIA